MCFVSTIAQISQLALTQLVHSLILHTVSATATTTSICSSFDQDDAIQNKLDELYLIQQKIKSYIDAILFELQTISDRIESAKDNHELLEILSIQSSNIYETQNELHREYELVTRQISELERVLVIKANTNGEISNYARHQTVPDITAKRTATHVAVQPRQTSPTSSQQIETPLARQQARPPSTVPSDDEFIENMMGDNLCGKQLQDMIKPIALPNSPTSASGHDSTIKSPKRRGSKYDAQMRYQTARIT